MRPSGFIVRFIDIGLILLFGFLVLSDIRVTAEIKLPGSDQSTSTEQAVQTFVTVEILGEDDFRITEVEGGRARSAQSLLDLEVQLTDLVGEYESKGEEVVVLIEPSPSSIIQITIDVMDLCDRNGIAKNITTESIRL